MMRMYMWYKSHVKYSARSVRHVHIEENIYNKKPEVSFIIKPFTTNYKHTNIKYILHKAIHLLQNSME